MPNRTYRKHRKTEAAQNLYQKERQPQNSGLESLVTPYLQGQTDYTSENSPDFHQAYCPC